MTLCHVKSGLSLEKPLFSVLQHPEGGRPMKCQRKYQWVKLPRNCLPQGKGVLGHWARLAARAAYRKGIGIYCGFENEVLPGMWAGGVVGLKSILGTRSRRAALEALEQLQELGYLSYSLDSATKKLEYTLLDWVANCSGQACRDQGVYALQGTGFLCLPRNIPDRLVGRVFEEADAWLDLWCHTVWQEPKNIFSHLAPAVQYGPLGAVLTLEVLGNRWGWEKTKVWRFFQKHRDAFPLYRLPGACGCLVFNAQYPTQQSVEGMGHPLPTQEEILSVLEKLRQCGGTAQIAGCDNLRLNKMTLWYSPRLLEKGEENCRVALSLSILRAYFSPCWKWKKCKDDCKEIVRKPGLGYPRGNPALFDGERKVSHERPEKDKPP